MRKWKVSKILLILLGILAITCNMYHVDAYTSNYSEPAILIRKGSYGTGVKWVQDMLNHHGYSLSVDGIFGNNTYQAVLQFQSSRGLIADGIVGNATRKALKSASVSQTAINAYYYTTANVHFRSGAGTNYASKGVLSKNTTVYVLHKRSDGWAYVKYNNTYGYIYAQYLTTLSNSLPTFTRGTNSLLGIIKNCKAYYANHNFVYNTAPGVRSIPADSSKSYRGYYYVDCSTFTSWVLYEYALANGNTAMQNYFSTQKSSSMFATMGANGGNAYLKVVDAKDSLGNVNLANAKAGDILVTNGHVEFFHSYVINSNGTITMKVYNCGSNNSVKVNGLTTSGTRNISDILYILRVK